jgi:hypothetical protein
MEGKKELFRGFDRTFKSFVKVSDFQYFFELFDSIFSKVKIRSSAIKDIDFSSNYIIWLNDKM